jgi:hypothetical protein
MVEGVKGGALRGTSTPGWSMTPDGGIDEVAVTGRAGSCGCTATGADVCVCVLVVFSDLRTVSADGVVRELDLSAEGCAPVFAGFAGFPDLSAESALRPSRVLSVEPGFADLSPLCGGCSDLRSSFAGLSGFCGDGACAGAVVVSEFCAAAARRPIVKADATTRASAASVQHESRKAFTDTDLSAAARYLHLLRLARIEEKLRRTLCNRRFSRQKRGIGPCALPRFERAQCNAARARFLLCFLPAHERAFKPGGKAIFMLRAALARRVRRPPGIVH